MKIGLILEGGAFKGTYTAGVLDTFLKYNIHIDECIASSSGALFALNYISKQPKRTYTLIREYTKNYHDIGLISYIKSGNVINDNIYKRMLQGYSIENFINSNISFYVTVTNVLNGKVEYIKITNPSKQIDYIKASCSMPFLSKFVKIDKKIYLDGGIKDNIPIKKGLEMNYDKLIVILTENYNYKMKKEHQLLGKIVYRNYPYLKQDLIDMDVTYNNTQELIKKLEQKNKIFVIKPSKNIKINKITRSTKKIDKLYNLGINDTIDNIELLKNYLNN